MAEYIYVYTVFSDKMEITKKNNRWSKEEKKGKSKPLINCSAGRKVKLKVTLKTDNLLLLGVQLLRR